jgi:hypothetical protein
MRIFYTHKIIRQKIAGKAEAKNTRINSNFEQQPIIMIHHRQRIEPRYVLILITTQAGNAHLQNNHNLIDKYQVMKACLAPSGIFRFQYLS